MAQRSRKKSRHAKRPARPAATHTQLATARARSEERNAAVRATLAPLAPGERPWSIKIAAVIAALSGGVQLALFLFGVKLKVAGTHAKAGSTIVFALLMLMCAGGVWMLRAWALLGFMVILGITVVGFSLALIKASSLLGFAIAIAGVGGGGLLFYKLVRILSRVQMPKPPSR